MNRRNLIAIVIVGITLAAPVAARQGVFEYFKAGTKRRSHSTLPPGRGHTSPAARATRPRSVAWTNTWFSDSLSVRRRVHEMADALKHPMMGETFPLPRGGGFVCSRTEGGSEPAGEDLVCTIECTGPELGGRRKNWFYVNGSNATPTLDRVRWVILAPPSASRASWRRLLVGLADSVSSTMGPPAWVGPDSSLATWRSNGYSATAKLHGGAAQVDSLEMECVSDRLAVTLRSRRKP